MYFYELVDPVTQASFYQDMMKKIPFQQKLAYNLTETFDKLAGEVSVDYWLNKKNPRF